MRLPQIAVADLQHAEDTILLRRAVQGMCPVNGKYEGGTRTHHAREFVQPVALIRLGKMREDGNRIHEPELAWRKFGRRLLGVYVELPEGKIVPAPFDASRIQVGPYEIHVVSLAQKESQGPPRAASEVENGTDLREIMAALGKHAKEQRVDRRSSEEEGP